ncbi:MAG: hypothetical protein ABI343_10890 [Burkholderiaceae bacterium]
MKTWNAISLIVAALASPARSVAATDSSLDAPAQIQQVIERFQTAVIKQSRAALDNLCLRTNDAWIALAYGINLDTTEVK